MNTDLRKNNKKLFGKRFFKLMSNSVFRKAMENVRKHRDIKLVTTEKRRNYLVCEPNYHSTENLLAIEMRKTQILMNKPFYFGLLILELSKIVIHEFWHDYVIKIDDIYKDIAKHYETVLIRSFKLRIR